MIKIKNITVIALLALAVLSQATEASALIIQSRLPDHRYYTRHYMPHGKSRHSLPRSYTRLIIGGLEYYYWEGMFYRRTADQYIVVAAPIGTVVTTIPQGCQPVVVDGVKYYNINGVTYVHTPAGYQVVPQPKTIVIKDYNNNKTIPVPGAGESFNVNVPNSKGGYTAVTLRRYGNGFIGPQGEYYTEFPKIEQLKVMYGK